MLPDVGEKSIAGLVSVIMPAYNVEKYLAESIESVRKQTYERWELIIVDDDSEDGTYALAEKYSRQDGRIRCFTKTNDGVSAARNFGMEQARGEYISFLDADDLWHQDFLGEMLAKISRGGDFVYARTEEFFEDGRRNLVGPEDCVRGRLEAFIHKTDELRLRFHISAMLIRKSLIDGYGLSFPPGIKHSEDTSFFIQILCVAEADFVPKVLSYYRRREASATTVAWRPENWAGSVEIYRLLEPFVQKNYPAGLAVFRRMRDYVAYRFVLKGVRFGCYAEMKTYIEKWKPWLKEFSRGRGKLGDRLKCRLLARNSTSVNKVIGRLGL